VGLACFTFILLYILDELSYDKYHNDYKRIYRIESDITISDKHQQVAKTSFAIGPTLKKEFPEIESFVRFREVHNGFLRYKKKKFHEDKLFYCDASVFDVFTYKFIAGTKDHALTQPNTIVLTESLALKYFGDEDPMDKVIVLNNQIKCKVSGIIEDIPQNTHLKFDGLISIESYGQIIGQKMLHDLSTVHFWAIRLYTYVKLKENTSIESIYKKFPVFHDIYIKEISEKLNGTYNLLSTRLDSIHLHSNRDWDLPTGNMTIVNLFTIIAIFILIIAGINYVNLSTAHSTDRARETGIRKVLGATRSNLTSRILGESVLVALFAFALACVIVENFLPYFNDIAEKELSFNPAKDFNLFLILFIVAVIIGLLSGIYPAYHLSSFQPINILKGITNSGRKSVTLRKFLIVFQFTISIVMIASTIIVSRQLNFVQNQELGFTKENVIVIRVSDTSFRQKVGVFKDKLLANPNIYNVTASNSIPGSTGAMDVFLVEGKDAMEKHLVNQMFIDYNFINLMGMKIIKGRNFDPKNGMDPEKAIIINWKAAKMLGWKEKALGKEIHRRGYKDYQYKVIGVIEDFHYTSLRKEIGPMFFILDERAVDLISIRYNPKNKAKTFASIEKVWSDLNPNEPFKFDHLEDLLNQLYSNENKLQWIISFFALFSIFISLLGLFGLSSYITEQYSKDIGIRKLLGASVGNIVYFLSSGFMKLILIAIIVALPIAWYIMDEWLDHFAYRLNIQIHWLILTGVLVMFVAQITVIFQTIKTALTNPVDAIKHE
jgi:putative ABC transport system permease protein